MNSYILSNLPAEPTVADMLVLKPSGCIQCTEAYPKVPGPIGPNRPVNPCMIL